MVLTPSMIIILGKVPPWDCHSSLGAKTRESGNIYHSSLVVPLLWDLSFLQEASGIGRVQMVAAIKANLMSLEKPWGVLVREQ